jgi:NAD(P)-dependent dehydrogenase (short-subunit alcohol dehydrogenase family)
MEGCDADRLLCHRYDALEVGTEQAWLDATVARFGRLDGLINNAGVMDTASLEDLTEESLDQMLAVNLKAPWRLTRLALPTSDQRAPVEL